MIIVVLVISYVAGLSKGYFSFIEAWVLINKPNFTNDVVGITCDGILLAAQKPITLKFVSKVHTVSNYCILPTADNNFYKTEEGRKF